MTLHPGLRQSIGRTLLPHYGTYTIKNPNYGYVHLIYIFDDLLNLGLNASLDTTYVYYLDSRSFSFNELS
jgi:hypothetical protein